MSEGSINLSFEDLKGAVSEGAAAFRCVTEYQPVGGSGSKVFPPTYAGSVYAFESRRLNGEEHQCVILDSVASQANRMEEALRSAWEEKHISLPVISVDFTKDFRDIGKVTSLDAPHRIADAILRYAKTQDGDEFFSRSRYAGMWKEASIHNATSLLEICPTALVFGIWGSPEATGGLGAKFQRVIVSEMIGVDAVPGAKTTSRIDPTGIRAGVKLYQAAPGSGDLEWTVDEKKAVQEKKKSVLLGKPSELNLGNVTPTAESPEDTGGLIKGGGVTISRALQFTTISLPAIRRLRFPLNDQPDPEVDVIGRIAVAALALCAATLTHEDGADLRSRCHLVPTSELKWELVGRPGEDSRFFTLDGAGATSLFNRAVEQVKSLRSKGLEWHDEEIRLIPSKQLVDAIQLSRARGGAEEVE